MATRGKIPISAAEKISKQYGCPMVLVFGIEASGDKFTITTYGETKALCRHAASLSEQFAKAIFNQTVAPEQVEPTHLPDVPSVFGPIDLYEERKAKQKSLIDAMNLLGEFVAENMPDSDGVWEIRLCMNRDESYIDLIDPNGNEIECQSADQGTSTIQELCDTANEREANHAD